VKLDVIYHEQRGEHVIGIARALLIPEMTIHTILKSAQETEMKKESSGKLGTVLSRFLTQMGQASSGNTCPLGPTFPRKENLLLVSSLERTE
jgi:hypothetical protein